MTIEQNIESKNIEIKTSKQNAWKQTCLNSSVVYENTIQTSNHSVNLGSTNNFVVITKMYKPRKKLYTICNGDKKKMKTKSSFSSYNKFEIND